jgi:hypothetical protein
MGLMAGVHFTTSVELLLSTLCRLAPAYTHPSIQWVQGRFTNSTTHETSCMFNEIYMVILVPVLCYDYDLMNS